MIEIRAGPSNCFVASIFSVLPSVNSSQRNKQVFIPYILERHRKAIRSKKNKIITTLAGYGTYGRYRSPVLTGDAALSGLQLDVGRGDLVETLQWIRGEVRSTGQIRGRWKWLATTEEASEQTHWICDIQLSIVVCVSGIFTECRHTIEEILEAMNRVTDVDCAISVRISPSKMYRKRRMIEGRKRVPDPLIGQSLEK
jgi:hypothetical protein